MKDRKTRGISSGACPHRRRAPAQHGVCALGARADAMVPPCGVYLSAFAMRLASIWSRRAGSTRSHSASASTSTVWSSSRPATPSAFTLRRIASARFTACGWIAILPAVRRATSSRSFTRRVRCSVWRRRISSARPRELAAGRPRDGSISQIELLMAPAAGFRARCLVMRELVPWRPRRPRPRRGHGAPGRSRPRARRWCVRIARPGRRSEHHELDRPMRPAVPQGLVARGHHERAHPCSVV